MGGIAHWQGLKKKEGLVPATPTVMALTAKLIFGNPGPLTGLFPCFESDPPPSNAGFPPAPLTDITAAYTLIFQSAMKPFLSGLIDTRIVPGGYIGNQLVFTSSLVHVFASAALFVLLTIALVVAQFRQRREAFTFVNVAAALADSDVPQKCVDMTQFKEGTGERKVLKLVRSGDGQLNCAYQSIDQE